MVSTPDQCPKIESDSEPKQPDRAKTKAISNAVDDLMEAAWAKTTEQYLDHCCDRIPFKDKVDLLDKHLFLRTYSAYKDCDEVWNDIRSVVIAGNKKQRQDAETWLKDNQDAFDTYTRFREDIHLAEIIEETMGRNSFLDNPDSTKQFRDIREESADFYVKKGFLGIRHGKKLREYHADTEAAADRMNRMIEDYATFRMTVEKDYEAMGLKDFLSKYSHKRLLYRK